MKVRFDNKKLSIIETDLAHKIKLPSAVVLSAQRKIRFMRETKDERDLRSWKSLHFEKIINDPDGDFSIRLNDQWRIVFDIDKSCHPNEINIKAIKDYH